MTRSNLHLPLVCTLVGGLWALVWAMVNRQCQVEPFRVPIRASLPVVVAGWAVGLGIGCSAHWLIRLAPARSPQVRLFLVIVTAASVAGPVGWLVRNEWRDRSGLTAILNAAATGAVAGLALFLVGSIYSRPRRPSPSSTA